MNHPFMIEIARSMLAHADVVGVSEVKSKITRLFRLAYGRPMNEEELATIRGYLGKSSTDPRRWQSLVQAILMANEFVFVD